MLRLAIVVIIVSMLASVMKHQAELAIQYKETDRKISQMYNLFNKIDSIQEIDLVNTP